MQYTTNTLEKHWMPFTGNRDFKADPRLVVRGQGVHYWDHKGGKILDGSSGLFCSAAGHCRPEIADAVRSLLLEHAERGTSMEELAAVVDVDMIGVV